MRFVGSVDLAPAEVCGPTKATAIREGRRGSGRGGLFRTGRV